MSGTGSDDKWYGQALVELAVISPLIFVFVFACFQFVIIFFAYLGVISATRDVARYLSVNPDTTDYDLIDDPTTGVKSRLAAILDPASLSISVTPSCSSYPCTVAAPCSATERCRGSLLSVTASYNAGSLIFLPSRIGLWYLVVDIPTTLPAYTMYVATENTT
jgi:Flp pilus assembly protein TadG